MFTPYPPRFLLLNLNLVALILYVDIINWIICACHKIIINYPNVSLIINILNRESFPTRIEIVVTTETKIESNLKKKKK